MNSRPGRIVLSLNGQTLRIAAVLLAIWYAAASQSNAAAYLLGFLIFGVVSVSAIHGWRNLRGLRLAAEPIPPVYEGEPLIVPVALQSLDRRAHYAIEIAGQGKGDPSRIDELLADSLARTELLHPPFKRGKYDRLQLTLRTTYPLGAFTFRQRVTASQSFHVYPRPEGNRPLPFDASRAREGAESAKAEGDDFAGVREWQLGESMRHIDWKAVARGQPLMSKQWSGSVAERLILEWQALAGVATEERLRQLAQWLVLAERGGAAYELRLPHQTVKLSQGEPHFHTCMRALAEAPDEMTELA